MFNDFIKYKKKNNSFPLQILLFKKGTLIKICKANISNIRETAILLSKNNKIKRN